MTPSLQIQLIAAVTAAACTIPGIFLVLRKMSLMSDAISHSILPGIVLGFFIVGNIDSPLLIAGAALMGLVTVFLTQALERTKLVKGDAAIGMVFPALFSIGVILVSRYAGNVHLDIDAVLLGELAFAPFDRLMIGAVDIGPKSLYTMGVILLLNILFMGLFFKELKIGTFDPALAGALGFVPVVMTYLLMGMVSITAVGAFDSVGSILVVALMITPPAAAYLLTDKLARMVWMSIAVAVIGSIAGYWLARALDASIAGSMAGMSGFIFLLSFFFSPSKGIAAQLKQEKQRRLDFAVDMLLVHLYHHEGEREAQEESRRAHLQDHIRWNRAYADQVVKRAHRQEMIVLEDQQFVQYLRLTARGEDRARLVMER